MNEPLRKIEIEEIPEKSDSLNDTLNDTLGELEIALGELDKITGLLVEKQKNEGEVEEQIQRLAEDRTELARQLDTANARANSLKEVNEQVSRRLVDVMEKIRYINSDRESEG